MTDYTNLPGFDFDRCRVCRAVVPPAMADLARRRVENAHCGAVACHRRELVMRFGCCLKAEPLGCVCTYAFRCTVHGDKHIGTHD